MKILTANEVEISSAPDSEKPNTKMVLDIMRNHAYSYYGDDRMCLGLISHRYMTGVLRNIATRKSVIFSSFDEWMPRAMLVATFNFKQKTVFIDLVCAIKFPKIENKEGWAAMLIVWFVYYCQSHKFNSISLKCTSEIPDNLTKPFDVHDGRRVGVSLVSRYQKLRFRPVGRPQRHQYLMRIDLTKLFPKNRIKFPLTKGWLHPIDTTHTSVRRQVVESESESESEMEKILA